MGKMVLVLAFLVSGSLFAGEQSFRQFGASCALTNKFDSELVDKTISEGYDIAGSTRIENNFCAYTFQSTSIKARVKISTEHPNVVQFGAACELTNKRDIDLVDSTINQGYKIVSVSNTDTEDLCAYTFQAIK